MTNILVTGVAGFIGGNIAAYFEREGQRVVTHASTRARTESGDASALSQREALSVTALQRVTAGGMPDAIIHAAGSGTVSSVAAQPESELPANLASLMAVLEYARLHAPRAHVVVLSSAALYGNAPATPQRESDARAPVSLYGLAKAQSEQLAAFYAAQHDMAITAVRLFSVYGPGLRKQLLWDAMVKFSQGAPSPFFGTGDERRDWTHIDDVCRFMGRLLAVSKASGFEVLNCSGGQVASTAELLGEMARAVGVPAPRFNGQVRAGDPACLLADCSEAEQRLDWRPEIDWRQGVAAYARWFQDQAQPSLRRA